MVRESYLECVSDVRNNSFIEKIHAPMEPHRRINPPLLCILHTHILAAIIIIRVIKQLLTTAHIIKHFITVMGKQHDDKNKLR